MQIAQAGSVADEAAAGAEEKDLEGAARGSAIADLPGVEVIRVMGRPMAAIETAIPESATQFDAAAIEALGAQNISDLAKVTPNVEIRTAGATAPTFFIRGVGLSDFSANAAGAVSVYQDEVAINAPAIQIGQLYDIENIEVLRGPQGGGSGRNASAGAIKISSRKPTGELAAEMSMNLGAYGSDHAKSAFTQDYEGALAFPLVEDMLATRLAFRFLMRDPYATNGCGDAPPVDERLRTGINPDPPPRLLFPRDVSICGERARIAPFGGVSPIPEGLPTAVNDAGVWAARGQLRFQPPGTEMDWLLNLHGSRRDELSTLGQAMGTFTFLGAKAGAGNAGYQEPDNKEMIDNIWEQLGDAGTSDLVQELVADELARNLDIRPYRGDYNRVGETRLDAWGGFLRGDWTIGSVNFTSISGYDTYERFRDTDQDFTPDVLFEIVNEDEAWQFSQELRATGELADMPLRWEAGGYYLMEQLHATVDSYLFDEAQNPYREYDQDLWSFGVFAGFSWDFHDDFTLEGGIRYNWERKGFDFTLTKSGLIDPETGLPLSRRTVTGDTWDALTGTISLTYRFAEDVSAYAKYSRGWKGGHFNATAQLLRNVVAAEPETIDAFEAGLRGRWLDGRLGLGLAAFYYGYTQYQVFIVADNLGAPPTYQIVNANDVEVYGAELDLRAEPLAGWVPQVFEGLVLTGRLGWLETQFLDFTNEIFRSVIVASGPPPVFDTLPIRVDYSGNQLINSPRLKASLDAAWTFDLGRWGTLVPSYNFTWTDDVFFDATQGLGSPNERGEVYLPEYAVGQRAHWLHNARLAYRTPGGNIEIAGWVRNLTDKVYKTYAFDASTFSNVLINYLGEPRTFGVSLSVNW
ncbi:MAG: TonB-dependent receptor [Deltaproteobacteria bacterium]|nr:TonB-dependent receptor [Deltaproteobacteria bacterium]